MNLGQLLLVAAFCVFIGWALAHALAPAPEGAYCKDGPDTKAYMARAPGNPHDTEKCIQVMRYGDPRWVPDFGSPLLPRRQ